MHTKLYVVTDSAIQGALNNKLGNIETSPATRTEQQKHRPIKKCASRLPRAANCLVLFLRYAESPVHAVCMSAKNREA